MAWFQPGKRPLFEPMMTQFSDTYMQLYGDMIYHKEFKFGWIREPLSVIKMINYQAKENCCLEEQ